MPLSRPVCWQYGWRGKGETATAAAAVQRISIKTAGKVVNPKEREVETLARTMPTSVPFPLSHYHWHYRYYLRFLRLFDTHQRRLRHYSLFQSVLTLLKNIVKS